MSRITPSFLLRALAFPTALLLPVVAPLVAQRPEPPSIGAIDRVEVRVFNVDVVVVDRKGNPVTDLVREDFELLVDGASTEISHFAAPFDPGAIAPEPGEEAPSRGEEATDNSRLASGVRSERGEPSLLVVYFDERNLRLPDRQRIRQDLEPFLTELNGENLRFLFAQLRNRLVLGEITSEPEELLAQLESLDRPFARSARHGIERSSTQSRIANSYESCEQFPFCGVCVDNWHEMLSFAFDYARFQQSITDSAAAGMALLVSALAGIEGHKIVLYVGDGISIRPGIAMIAYLKDLCPQRERDVQAELLRFNATSGLNRLAAHANANRVTFYMLDSGGARMFSAADASYGRKLFVPTAENDRIRISNLQGGLFLIANETGGEAIFNADRPKHELADMMRDLAGSYSLGFTASGPATGRVRLIDVRLQNRKSKGRQIRHRRTYLDKGLEAFLADRLLAALYLEETENPLGVMVGFGASVPVMRKVHTLPIEIAIPVDSVSRFRGAEGELGQLRVWLAALDQSGSGTTLRQKIIPVGSDVSEPQGGAYRLVVDIDLGEGRQTIAVGVRDEISAIESYVRLDVDVPRAPSGR